MQGVEGSPGVGQIGVLLDPGVHGDAGRDAGVDAARRAELRDRHRQPRARAGVVGDAGALLAEHQQAFARQRGLLQARRAWDVVHGDHRQPGLRREAQQLGGAVVVAQPLIAIGHHGAAAIPPPPPHDVHGVHREGVGRAHHRTDVGVVAEVLDGKFVREERFLLDAILVRGEKEIANADAMNEVVIHRGSSLRMIEFGLYIDGQFVYSQRSDGLIVSTPTGSTAYALSGGGPILHPTLDAIALVPMFSHALTSRPIVVDGNCEIKIVLGNYRGGQPELSCDGQHHFSIETGDVVFIHKKQNKLSLIHPMNHNYYETCRTKLGWGSRLS